MAELMEQDEGRDCGHEETINIFCAEKAPGETITFHDMDRQQRKRVLEKGMTVGRNNGVVLAFQQDNPRASRGKFIVTMVQRSTTAEAGDTTTREVETGGSRVATAAVVTGAAVTMAQLRPYLQLISMGMEPGPKIACIEGLLAVEECQRIKDGFPTGWAEQPQWTTRVQNFQVLQKPL